MNLIHVKNQFTRYYSYQVARILNSRKYFAYSALKPLIFVLFLFTPLVSHSVSHIMLFGGANYTFESGQCENIYNNSTANNGPCGTSNTAGDPEEYFDYSGAHISGTGGGILEIFDLNSNGLIISDGTGGPSLTNASLSLTAIFDYQGELTGGSLSILGSYPQQSAYPFSYFQSGTIASSSNLVALRNTDGFQSFIFGNSTGDLISFTGLGDKLIVSAASNDFSDWTHSFSSNDVQTFAMALPLPATAWLFFSALFGIASLKLRTLPLKPL